MFFVKNGHQIRFLKAVIYSDKYETTTGVIDREYGTASYLLTSSPDIWRICEMYTDDGIDFPDILANDCFSFAERIIVQLAWILFDPWGKREFTLGDMINSLEDEYYFLCLEALRLRRSNDMQLDSLGAKG
jgi:hypothetical protein